jgi:hypothetical protein
LTVLETLEPPAHRLREAQPKSVKHRGMTRSIQKQKRRRFPGVRFKTQI